MSRGKKEARRAREASESAAAEAREQRAALAAKEAEEKDKIQRKLIRGIKGRFNPFEFLPDSRATLGKSERN
jgi:hypothetical protein